jgi:signal transduction histidine kinase
LPRNPHELTAVVDALPHGVIALNPDLSVSFANRAAKRALHPHALRPGDPLPSDGMSETDLAQVVRGLIAADGSAGTHTTEIRFGRERFALTGIAPAGSRPPLLVLERAGLADQRRRARDEFVANAAHELLTPLTGIVGAAHALESGAKDVPEIRDRFVGHIARECTRLGRIARSLLVLARAQSGEQPPRAEFVDLNELFEELVRDAADEPAVDVRCPAALTVFVDRDLTLQALANIVANAQRHTQADAITVTVDERDTVVNVEVDDGGPGIDPADVERMQRRFVSGGGGGGGGYGLGISIATQSLEAVGGTLSFDETVRGVHARIELPRGQQ